MSKLGYGGGRPDYGFSNPPASLYANDMAPSKPFSLGPIDTGSGSLNPVSSFSSSNHGRPQSMYGSEASSGSWGLPSVRPSSWIGGDIDRPYPPPHSGKNQSSFNPGWQRPPSSLSSTSSSSYSLSPIGTHMLPSHSGHDSLSAHSPTSAPYSGTGLPSNSYYSSRPYDPPNPLMPPSGSPPAPYQSGPMRDTPSYLHRSTSQDLPSISSYSLNTNHAGQNIHGNWTRD
jgi:hypothetical protein